MANLPIMFYEMSQNVTKTNYLALIEPNLTLITTRMRCMASRKLKNRSIEAEIGTCRLNKNFELRRVTPLESMV